MYFLVASLAQADKLSLVCVWIVQTKRKVWPVFDVLDMVDDNRTAVPAPCLAPLAIIVIKLQYLCPELLPFRPVIEAICTIAVYQPLQSL